MNPAERLIEACFAADPGVRYVAVYSGGELRLAQRPGIQDASAGETDRFEELLVNPAILTLTRQRGEIDCGGLEYVLIRYGHFFTLVRPVPAGHVNIGLALDVDLNRVPDALLAVVASWAAAGRGDGIR